MSLSQSKFSGYGESMFRAHEADVIGMSLFHRVVQSGIHTPLYSILPLASENLLGLQEDDKKQSMLVTYGV